MPYIVARTKPMMANGVRKTAPMPVMIEFMSPPKRIQASLAFVAANEGPTRGIILRLFRVDRIQSRQNDVMPRYVGWLRHSSRGSPAPSQWRRPDLIPRLVRVLSGGGSVTSHQSPVTSRRSPTGEGPIWDRNPELRT
jgi:hypothetical protein